MFDINFPIFAKGAVVKEEVENADELPDVWRFLSGKIDCVDIVCERQDDLI